MKIKLIFDTSDQEQKQEFKRISKAEDMALLLWNYREALRARIKFEDELPAKFIEGLENAVKILGSLCEDSGIDIDDLNN